ATRFIFLRESSYSGTLEFYKNGNIKFNGKVYDDYRFENSFFRMIPKFLKFNKIYNDINLRIYNMDAFKLLELDEFKNNPDCLINLDPPYFLQEDIQYTIDDLKTLESKHLKDCKISYNQPNFPHLDVLNLFPKINFIYNNNSHQILDYYNEKFGVKSMPYDRKEKMTATKDKKTKIVQETISYHNSLLKNL
ncbi:MAG: hypothetical protein U9Q33_04875, partial [Campylobacterota bacterium]|nr:hypothetical protein [Campylobacterota bacterium]